MKHKNFKKIIKDLENERGNLRVAEILESDGEKELADFARFSSDVKKHIEPDRSLMLKILNDVSEQPKTMDNQMSSVSITKVGIQLHMGRILKFAIPAALAILIAIFIWQNPFRQEKSQVSELKDITKEEKAADQANNSLRTYLSEGNKSVQISRNFGSGTGNSNASSSEAAPFDTAAITSEAGSLNFDPGLADFIAQEKSMNAIDATLANF